jgi:tRNA modification GTPase
MPDTDTIVAISTPPGRGGIGIVRLSGSEPLSIATRLLALKQPLQHAQARFTRILDEDGTVIDEAVVTAFLAPNSYTGEDLVEIAAHGSPVVLDYIVRRALSLGARIAEPGEYSRRAFLAGRLDLTQAEAIHDLIAAQTLAQARTAAQQLGGALSRRVAPIKQQLVHLIAMLEAGMDFATGELDDVDTMPPTRIAAGITAVQEPLAALAASFRFGSIQRNGVKLALVGRPNAGKSSLFNRLLDRDRAIVTATPGTTRDTIEETFSLNGIPVHLIDTAGLRGSQSGNIDEAEALGIARSREALAEADLVLLVHDATADPTNEPGAPGLASETWDSTASDLDPLLRDRPIIRVRNKIDLLANIDYVPGEVSTSALTGAGLDELRAAVLAHLRSGSAGAEEGALNNLRQHGAVTAALTALDAAESANGNHLPHELLLVDLHTALAALDSLTGVTTTDDILALIFSTFCIGK